MCEDDTSEEKRKVVISDEVFLLVGAAQCCVVKGAAALSVILALPCMIARDIIQSGPRSLTVLQLPLMATC